jgi:hypothetical protein
MSEISGVPMSGDGYVTFYDGSTMRIEELIDHVMDLLCTLTNAEELFAIGEQLELW